MLPSLGLNLLKIVKQHI